MMNMSCTKAYIQRLPALRRSNFVRTKNVHIFINEYVWRGIDFALYDLANVLLYRIPVLYFKKATDSIVMRCIILKITFWVSAYVKFSVMHSITSDLLYISMRCAPPVKWKLPRIVSYE